MGFGVQGLGFRVEDLVAVGRGWLPLSAEVPCLGVQGLGLRVWGVGLRVWGEGFRV